MNQYIWGSGLAASLVAVTDILEFLKQGDTIRVSTITPPVTFHYAGTPAYTNSDELCVAPSDYPHKYEGYKWPETIEMDNLSLSLVESESFGVVTNKAPLKCLEYQPGGSASGYTPNWEFVGSGMTVTYIVSQVYRAGSATSNIGIGVISGRSEYAPREIVNKIKNLQNYFQSVNVTLTANVKNWCSASIGRKDGILLDHKELSAGKINNHQVSSSIQLSCQGEGADFYLKWFDGGNAESKTINIKRNLQTELKVQGVSANGVVNVPANSTVNVDITSTLKSIGDVDAGPFSASQILVIEVV
ncbi:MrpH family fimbial adhesin [Escherichia coli]|uniref:MrpH family fimbial adhesin n=1 Tax=Escherichia coli TaxID=562 RepID=UPI00203547AC|nr:hypothetical protein [Escherichia coli]